jgi:hypothetical protein
MPNRRKIRRKHPRLTEREKGIRQEMKEHPWAGRKLATRIEKDHERKKENKLKILPRLHKAREDFVSSPNFETSLRETYSK